MLPTLPNLRRAFWAQAAAGAALALAIAGALLATIAPAANI